MNTNIIKAFKTNNPYRTINSIMNQETKRNNAVNNRKLNDEPLDISMNHCCYLVVVAVR